MEVCHCFHFPPSIIVPESLLKNWEGLLSLMSPFCSGRSSLLSSPLSLCNLNSQGQRGGRAGVKGGESVLLCVDLLVVSWVQIIKINEIGSYPRWRMVVGDKEGV